MDEKKKWIVGYVSVWIVIYIIYIAYLFHLYNDKNEQTNAYYVNPMIVLTIIALIFALVLEQKLNLGYRGGEFVLFVSLFIMGILMYVTDWVFSKLKDKPMKVFLIV